ncbi:hypothetical protein MTBBW1_2720006 [Desulfamplus magnetovallimortis]|uniref:Uncharacterized protein n=1 Tax=Desulfamplus magnetovallimortis TaxID=1246637 RepID=A0A1W1HF65_9BACT|nr:hypothetical protein [Desulfamplus magnetovallimortis]SLM31129.1 hypothetical protein MTBBW1_2720006 [Desulfamplus magnetovallimortis]
MNKEKQIERCKFIAELYNEFVKQDKDFNNLYLCHEIVFNVVASYYDDIDRIKQYHASIKLADFHKIAAFTAKWIVHLRPIQINEGQLTNSKDKKLLVNEYFALYVITVILGIQDVLSIPASLRYNLLYMFRYRHFTGRTLATICYCLEEINSLKKSLDITI